MKRWRCSICGYIHEGDIPPEKCPICGAPGALFEELKEAGETAGSGSKGAPGKQGEADVVVVGSGAAAFSAAVAARQAGLSVVMLEKGEGIGGTTMRSGGGFWIPANRHQREAGIADTPEDAIPYMARYSYPHLYNPEAERLGLPEREYALIHAYAHKASEAVDFLEECGAISTIMEINWKGVPQVDYMDHLPENKGVRGRPLYTKDAEGRLSMGFNLIGLFSAWAKQHGIAILTGHEVVEILKNADGEVAGVAALADGEPRVFHARRAVVFGSGGFSHNPELMLRFQRGPHFGGCSAPTNTGDFIRLAGAIGAAIGNTAGAFRAQSMVEVWLANPAGSSNMFFTVGDSVFTVDKYGRRIMDEKRDYTDRGMTHFVWDPVRAEWKNMLQFMIFDERAANMWNGTSTFPIHGELPPHVLRADSLEALADALAGRLEKLAPHTGGFRLAPEFLPNLRETLARFNGFARTGKDLDFGRGDYTYDREWTTFPPAHIDGEWPDPNMPNYTMYPLSENGPYYAVILGAGTLDTNGGPLTDEHARVLDWQYKPIPGLYGAGNCIASPTANAYWGGGSTIGPALTFGYLAGRDAALQPERPL